MEERELEKESAWHEGMSSLSNSLYSVLGNF
jgi:hypothetical protein